MNISCIIIEDDNLSAKHLERLISQERELNIEHIFNDANKALDFLMQELTDLIFLDVEMPNLNGFELLDSLPYRPLIILTTSKTEYAFTAFQYNVIDYLKKPITIPRFKEAIEKVKPLIHKQYENEENDLFIKADGKLIRLPLNDILYIEALGDYVKFVTPKKTHLSLITLKVIEYKLKYSVFLKVHRSYIINIKKITRIEDNTILIDQHVIPISKTYKKIVLEKLHIVN